MSGAHRTKGPSLASIRAFAFDLDGTLIDSFADLAAAINATRADQGLPPLPQAEVARHVGNGSEHLVRHTVPGPPEHAEAMHRRFLAHYDRHLLDATRPYPGAEALLERLAGRFLGLVTNKPQRQTEAILAGLGWNGRFGLVLGGDSLPKRKPDPLPLRVFLERAGCQPEAAAIVGDGAVDVQAGKSAGMLTVALCQGNTVRDLLASEQPDCLLDDLTALLAILS